MSQGLSQGIALLEKTQSLGWALEIDLSAQDSKLVAEAGSIKLYKYTCGSKKARQPILLIPSFINRHYILDLLPEKSLIQYYLKAGFDVYLINWGQPEEEDKLTSFETLFTVHLDYLVSKMKIDANSKKFHIIGQCLGGNIGLIYSLLNPKNVCSLSLLTTPVNFNHAGKLKDWARHQTLHLEKFIEACGNAPWMWMQLGFLGMKPTQLFTKYKKLFDKRNDEKFRRSFMALETWSFDNINVRGQLFLTLIQQFYRDNAWLNDGFKINRKNLRIADLQVPVSVLNAEDDHIVPLECTLEKHHVPKADYEKWNSRGGHIGALIGGHSQQTIWPKMLKWIKRYDLESLSQ